MSPSARTSPKQRPAVLEAFLKAQRRPRDYLHAHPVAAAESVAKATGLPAEVVYLYNGAHGIATFDPTLKPQLVAALKQDVPVLKAAKLTGDVDVDSFVDDQYVKKALGSGYAERLAADRPPAAASELWLKGDDKTRSFKSPGRAAAVTSPRHKDAVRAAYVPDATTGTLWFADKAVWVADGDAAPALRRAGDRRRPTSPRTAGARVITYADALGRAS